MHSSATILGKISPQVSPTTDCLGVSVKKLGGNDNAFTGQDYTAYFQTIAVAHLDKMLLMEADRMVNLKVPKKHFFYQKD